MPKQIYVTLQTITCNRNGFGGAVQVSGDVFGEAFQDVPNDPAQSTGVLAQVCPWCFRGVACTGDRDPTLITPAVFRARHRAGSVAHPRKAARPSGSADR